MMNCMASCINKMIYLFLFSIEFVLELEKILSDLFPFLNFMTSVISPFI